MARRVVVHAGLMKSGTTYVQGRLGAARQRLLADGVLFPGPTWARQVKAVKDLVRDPGERTGDWQRLLAEIAAHPGDAVISMEHLGPMRPVKVAECLADLATTTPDAGAVEVVLTVRDLGRAVPAMWQETLKNRRTWTWQEYVAGIAGEPIGELSADAGRRFWRQQDAARIVGRWTEAAPGRVTLVTLPPPGAPSSLLWGRFSEATGLPLRADDPPPPRGNASLGAASALLLRRLNELTGDLDQTRHKRTVKALGDLVLPRHRDAEEAIGFQVPAWLHRRAERQRSRLAALAADGSARVVGDLADLAPCDVPGVDPGTVPDAAQVEAAVGALDLLLRQTAKVRPCTPPGGDGR